jgi:acetylornithine deacetylase
VIDPANLLETLVSIPSVSGSEQAITDRLWELLAAEGIQARRTRGNLHFELGGRGPRLLLVSHLDTVPPGEGWSADPLKPWWAGQRLFGLGANDAKGCVAAMVLAALALKGRGADPGARFVFAFTTGEEVGGKGIQELLPELGALDAAVVGEPTGLTVCTAQRGMLILRCTARGTSAHVAHAHLGENAVHKAARDIARLDAMRFEPHLLLGEARAQVTQVGGGRAKNQVPDLCEFMVDVRSTPNLDHASLTQRIAAELESEVEVFSDRYRPVATGPEEPVVRAALAAAGTQGGTGSSTASDWAHLGGLPAVKAGPGDTYRSHRPDEWLSLGELRAGAAFYEKLSLTYARMACQPNNTWTHSLEAHHG